MIENALFMRRKQKKSGQKNLDPKNSWVQKNFGSKKIWVKKNFESKKTFCVKKCLGPENFWSGEILGPEKFCVKTNLCYRKIGIELGLIGTSLGNNSIP